MPNVVDPDRQAQPPVELVAHPHVEQARQVRPDAQHTAEVDEAGDADPDRPDLVVRAEPAHDLGHGVEQRGRALGCRDARLADHRGGVGRVEGHAQDLRAPDVDADDELVAGAQ